MSPCVAVLQPLHQTAQARVDLGRVHTKGFTCTTSVSCWAKPLKQTIQCLDRGFHGGHWQNEGYDSILFNPGDGGDQASILFSKIFICQICQICQVPNTYVMWCHVCHVIWKNDFWRHFWREATNRLNGKRGEYMIWDKNRVLSMRRVWASEQWLIQLTSSGHPKKKRRLCLGLDACSLCSFSHWMFLLRDL